MEETNEDPGSESEVDMSAGADRKQESDETREEHADTKHQPEPVPDQSDISIICVNQSEISFIMCQPIRDQYYYVSTNQRSVLLGYSQSEKSITW